MIPEFKIQPSIWNKSDLMWNWPNISICQCTESQIYHFAEPHSYMDGYREAEKNLHMLKDMWLYATLEVFSKLSSEEFENWKEHYLKRKEMGNNANPQCEEGFGEQIRRVGEDRDESGNSRREKGGGEGNENVFVEGNGSDV